MIFALGPIFTADIFADILIIKAGFKSHSDLNYFILFHFISSKMESGFIAA
jgi:hypothetical protein